MKINERFFIFFRDNVPYLIDSRGRGNEYKITNLEFLDAITDFLRDNSGEFCPNNEFLKVFFDKEIIVSDEYQDECCLDTVSQLYFSSSRESIISNDSYLEIFKKGILNTIKTKKGRPFPKKCLSNFSTVHKLPLPKKNNIMNTSFFDLLKMRKTYRVFEPNFFVSIQSLSNILFTCFGPFHGYEEDLPKNMFRRTSPMNGGLRSIDPYIFVYNVDGIDPGTYFYVCEDHTLGRLGDSIPYSSLHSALHYQEYSDNCSFAIVLSANFKRQTWKYSTSRNVKVLFMDAGCLTQTIQLVSASECLQTWITGAMNVDFFEDVLGINSNEEGALFFIAVGKSNKTYDIDVINNCYKELGVKPIYNDEKRTIGFCD